MAGSQSPLTHRTYLLVGWPIGNYAILDALFALTVQALIPSPRSQAAS